MVRKLMDDEIAEPLNRDTVARLATVDTDGYPHVTPMWFLWASGRFYLTSFTDRPHLAHIRANPRVGLVVDIEDDLRPDGERPNKQVRATGHATVTPDTDGTWTTRLRTKYIDQSIAADPAHRDGRDRALITIIPRTMTAIASV